MAKPPQPLDAKLAHHHARDNRGVHGCQLPLNLTVAETNLPHDDHCGLVHEARVSVRLHARTQGQGGQPSAAAEKPQKGERIAGRKVQRGQRLAAPCRQGLLQARADSRGDGREECSQDEAAAGAKPGGNQRRDHDGQAGRCHVDEPVLGPVRPAHAVRHHGVHRGKELCLDGYHGHARVVCPQRAWKGKNDSIVHKNHQRVELHHRLAAEHIRQLPEERAHCKFKHSTQCLDSAQ
mmetsp:Transcript_46328/g.104113  ORF Transcript_46328/g.104113 Transcript_46328/m.104113 type:complete len:236 (-) Transcript_46328:332-1039(-)